MDIDISREAIRSKVTRAERRFWRRRLERAESQYVSMDADLAGLREREIFYIQACCALQREIDEHKDQEAQHQAVVDVFINTQMDYYEEDEFEQVVANLPEAIAQRAAGDRANRAFRTLKLKLRSLLAYTELRRNLHIGLTETCSRQGQSGSRITEEQRATLLDYSLTPEYHVHSERRAEEIDERFYNIMGGGMFGYFELLDLSLDVVASVH